MIVARPALDAKILRRRARDTSLDTRDKRVGLAAGDCPDSRYDRRKGSTQRPVRSDRCVCAMMVDVSGQ